jgi:excisionase family DNA binding protein
MPKRFVGVDALAEYLDVKKSTLYRWVHEQRIPHYKIGGLVKFELEKIDRWLKNKEVKPLNMWWKEK